MTNEERNKGLDYLDFLSSRGYPIFLSGIARPKHWPPTEDEQEALDYIRQTTPIMFRRWFDKQD